MSTTTHIPHRISKVRELHVEIDARILQDQNNYNLVTVEEFDTVVINVLLPHASGRTRTRQIRVPADDFKSYLDANGSTSYGRIRQKDNRERVPGQTI